MNKTIFLMALTAIWAPPTVAAAQQSGAAPTLEGVARSASLMQAIGEFCPPLMDVNGTLAERYARAFIESGEQAFGKPAFAAVLATESRRRAGEVKRATPETWCIDQRERLKPIGGADLFSRERK